MKPDRAYVIALADYYGADFMNINIIIIIIILHEALMIDVCSTA